MVGVGIDGAGVFAMGVGDFCTSCGMATGRSSITTADLPVGFGGDFIQHDRVVAASVVCDPAVRVLAKPS